MRTRCTNHASDSYPDYGERGITYDPRWNDFEAFLSDMGEPPPGLTLDRIDVNGNYCKANCRWATRKQQANNQRSNRLITHTGLTYTLAQWASITGIGPTTIRQRLVYGWSVARTLTEPVRTNSGLRHSAVISIGV